MVPSASSILPKLVFDMLKYAFDTRIISLHVGALSGILYLLESKNPHVQLFPLFF